MYFWEMRICSEILFGAFALAKQLKVIFFSVFSHTSNTKMLNVVIIPIWQ